MTVHPRRSARADEGEATSHLLRNVRLVGVPAAAGPVDVLVIDGLVAAISDAGDDGLGSLRTAETTELEGRYLLRGLWDHHVHFKQWALTRRRIDLSPAGSVSETIDIVARDLGTPKRRDDVVVGFGFRDATWGEPLRKEPLDAATGDVPVVLLSGDLHCGWLNSAALDRFGLDGHPTGLLREHDLYPVVRALEEIPESELDAWVGEAALAAAGRGVVGAVELEQADNIADWTRRNAAGIRAVRVDCGVYPDHVEAAIQRRLRTSDPVPGTCGLVRMGPLKVFTDGSLNTRTAFCYDPYPGLEHDRDSHGMQVTSLQELVRLMRIAADHGITSAIHAIGDHANALALDAFEQSGARGSVEHAQLLSPADLRRFAELRVAASVQPHHAVQDRDVADLHWKGRTDRAFPFGQLHAAGATLLLGSDAPVAPLDPWNTIAAAVTRTSADREPWHPEQNLSVVAALEASTWGRFQPQVGDTADLAVIDLDPLSCPPTALRSMPVHATMLAGRWTWPAASPVNAGSMTGSSVGAGPG